jgi:MFS transporter, FSR family, fosmidomycin resistance protein
MATEAHALLASVRADRRALAAIAAGHLSSDMCQGAVPALLPYLISQRGLSYAEATALLLALTVSSSVIQPVLGHASDRMQGAWLMPAGVLVGGIGIALAGVAGSYAATLAAVVFGGVGVAAFHPEGARYVPLVSGSGASSGMGLYSVGGNAGFVVGPVVVTAGVAAFGLRGTLLVALIPALSALLLWSVRPRLVAAAAAARAAVTRADAADADDWRAFTVLAAMVVARTAVGYGLLAFVPIWFVRHLDASAGAGNAALTLLLAAGAAGTLLGGRLADRHGARPVVVGGTAALFPLVALLPVAGEAAAFPLCAAIGAALDLNFGITVVLAQRLLPSRPGAASGLVLGFAFGLGGAVAAGLGVVADSAGLTAVMAVLAGVAFLAFVLSLFCRVRPAPRAPG